jgi:hypothetical protein
MLEKILQNKLLQATIFKQLRSLAKEHNIKSVVLTFDEKHEMGFDAKVYMEDVKVLTKKELMDILSLTPSNENINKVSEIINEQKNKL